ALSALIAGIAVTPFGGTLQLPANGLAVRADVSGAGGPGFCTATVAVNPVQVGVNFEDGTDADYNDGVLCMSGIFEIAPLWIISHAEQVVSAQVSKSAACSSTINVKVTGVNGNIEYQLQ